MAANLDKSENSLTSVSTLTYLRGIDASGNSVKISTSDLASVLGVTFAQELTSSDDLNRITVAVRSFYIAYYDNSIPSNAPNNRGSIFIQIKIMGFITVQIVFGNRWNDDNMYFRSNWHGGSPSDWGNWSKVSKESVNI